MEFPQDPLWRRGLSTLRKYTYFFAILAYGLGALIIIFALAVIAGVGFTKGLDFGGAGQIAIGLLYLLASLLYILPAGYLLKAAQALKRAETAESVEEVLASIPWLGQFFRFYGILAIIILVFYAAILLFVLLGVSFGASGILG